LSLRRLPGCQPLEPESGFNEILDASVLSFLIGESNDFIREPSNERDEDHSRGHLIPEGEMMGNERKDKDAHQHHDEQETRSTSRMEITEPLHPISDQHLSCLEGKDRLVLCPMVFKDPSNLFKKEMLQR
jgi:hypothetical protein